VYSRVKNDGIKNSSKDGGLKTFASLEKKMSQYNLRSKSSQLCPYTCVCKLPTEEKIDENLGRLRREDFFPDMEMVGLNSRYETRKFMAHKVVMLSRLGPNLLEAHDAYFTDDDVLTVPIDVPGHILEDLISLAYTGSIDIDHSNVQHHLDISKKFDIKCLTKMVIDYLVNSLSIDNALCNFRLAKQVNCHKNLDLIKAYILKHILLMAEQGNDFTDSQPEDLVNFITDDRLFATEEELFQLIAKWLKMGFTNRKSLLNYVRYTKMSLEFIRSWNTVEPDLPSQADRFLATAIKNADNHHATGGEKFKNLEDFRLPPEITLVIGGYNYSYNCYAIIDALNLRSGTWNQFKSTMRISRNGAGEGISNNKVYIFGGSDDQNGGYHKRNVCFDSDKQKWSMAQNMNQRRCQLATATFGGYIYAIGGSMEDLEGCGRTAERYDPQTNKWTNLPPMTQARYKGSAVSYNGNIWVLGGRKNYESSIGGGAGTTTVEIFNPNTMEWTNGPSMLTARVGHKAITHDGTIFVIGGYGYGGLLKSVERLDVTNGGSWHFVHDLHLPRNCFAVAKVSGRILVLGGFQGPEGATDSSEIYDTTTDTWSSYTPMRNQRAGHLAVTLKIKDFENLQPYPKYLLGKD
jgi:N-acetylneuraminic acid mutarotase